MGWRFVEGWKGGAGGKEVGAGVIMWEVGGGGANSEKKKSGMQMAPDKHTNNTEG
jgi:hypothetical protein